MYPFHKVIFYPLLLCLAANASAQIDSGVIRIVENPAVSRIQYTCPVSSVQVVPAVSYPGLVYTVTSISPGNLPLPPSNTTGIFHVPGATALSVVVSNQGCVSPLVLQSMPCNPLSLRVIDFNATLINGNRGLLSWHTANEENTDRFLLEKSPDAGTFHAIAEVAAKGQATNSYQWTDNDLYTGNNYYRVRQIDRDGQEYFTEVRVLQVEPADDNPVQLYPNPTDGLLNLALTSGIREELSVRILNAAGQQVMPEKRFPVAIGRNTLQVRLEEGHANGTYVLHYTLMGSGRSGSIRFLKESR